MSEAGRVRIFVVMTLSVILAAGSNLILRHSMGQSEADSGVFISLLQALMNPSILLGLVGYGLSQLLWLNVLNQARLGAVFPIYISTSFIFVMFGSAIILGEPLTVYRLGGACLVAGGIIVSEWSSVREDQASS